MKQRCWHSISIFPLALALILEQMAIVFSGRSIMNKRVVYRMNAAESMPWKKSSKPAFMWPIKTYEHWWQTFDENIQLPFVKIQHCRLLACWRIEGRQNNKNLFETFRKLLKYPLSREQKYYYFNFHRVNQEKMIIGHFLFFTNISVYVVNGRIIWYPFVIW